MAPIEQPLTDPHNQEALSRPARASREGQEVSSGPEGQNTSGGKVEGQYRACDPSKEGQETGVDPYSVGRLNR